MMSFLKSLDSKLESHEIDLFSYILQKASKSSQTHSEIEIATPPNIFIHSFDKNGQSSYILLEPEDFDYIKTHQQDFIKKYPLLNLVMNDVDRIMITINSNYISEFVTKKMAKKESFDKLSYKVYQCFYNHYKSSVLIKFNRYSDNLIEGLKTNLLSNTDHTYTVSIESPDYRNLLKLLDFENSQNRANVSFVKTDTGILFSLTDKSTNSPKESAPHAKKYRLQN